MDSLQDPVDIRIYRLMVVTRRFEERMNELFTSGLVRERPHSSIGQEAVTVAATVCLDHDDLVMPSLRSRGAYIAKGVPLKLIFADAFCKAAGPSGGKWTSHHADYPEYGVLWGSAMVASSIPLAVGAALAVKYKRLGKVTLVFFGDGATSRGDFHEALNLASVMDLPIVFVCENNQFALSTPLTKQMKVQDIAMRGSGYGIPSLSIDGNDAREVYRVTAEAITRARSGLGPSFVGCNTYRWRGHTEMYPPELGRTREELEAWQARGPIRRLRAFLRDQGLLDDQSDAEIRELARKAVEEAVEWARKAPDVAPEGTENNAYAE